MLRRLAGAIQFLTVIPLPVRGATPAQSAVFFPFVGAALGWSGAWMLAWLDGVAPRPIASLLIVLFWIFVTGALHENGLADCADAFRANRTAGQIFAILRDSRIGVFGGLALIISVLLRAQAIDLLALPRVSALVAAQTLPRSALVVLAWYARPAGDGSGAAFSAGLSTLQVVLTALLGVALTWWAAGSAVVPMLGVCILGVLAARRFFHARLGGVTGDGLGALEQILEMLLLVMATCGKCSW